MPPLTYHAVVGVIAGYIQNASTSHGSKVVLAVLLSVTSIFGIVGCLLAKRFVGTIKERLDAMTDSLGLQRVPLGGASGISVMMILVSSLFVVGGIGYAWFLAHS
jgi:hypothetical protein